MAFYLSYKGVHWSKENQSIIFFTMSGVVLGVGLFTAIFLVKDKPIQRDYICDKDGKCERVKRKVAIDEDPEDSGSDVDQNLLQEGA